MDLKQLRYFTAIVDHGSVRGAAAALNISQPALSVAVRNLEETLGTPLFERVGRGIEATAHGHRFYRHARSILAQSDKAIMEMQIAAGNAEREVKVAAPGMIANHVIAGPIARFLSVQAGVKVQVNQLAGPMVEQALLQGEIDIGFTTRAMGEPIAQKPLFQQKAVACLPKGHPSADAASLDWPQLLDMPLATLPQSYLIHRKLRDEARKHRKSPQVVLETDVMLLLAEAVRTGAATGLMIHSAVPDDLVAVPISGPEQMPFTIYGCWRQDIPLSAGADQLIDYLTGQANRYITSET